MEDWLGGRSYKSWTTAPAGESQPVKQTSSRDKDKRLGFLKEEGDKERFPEESREVRLCCRGGHRSDLLFSGSTLPSSIALAIFFFSSLTLVPCLLFLFLYTAARL